MQLQWGCEISIYIYIYIYIGLNCTVPASSSSCKAFVRATTVGLRNFYGVAKIFIFAGVEKFHNPCKNYWVLLLALASPLLQKFDTNCKNKHRKNFKKCKNIKNRL